MSMLHERPEIPSWPLESIHLAFSLLIRESGLSPVSPHLPPLPETICRQVNTLEKNWPYLDTWFEYTSQSLKIVSKLNFSKYSEFKELLATTGPLLIPFQENRQVRILSILSGKHQSVQVLTPEGKMMNCALNEVVSLLCHSLEQPVFDSIAEVMKRTGVSMDRLLRGKHGLFESALSEIRLPSYWSFHLSYVNPVLWLFWKMKFFHGLGKYLALYCVVYVLGTLSWITTGTWGLSGRFERGWFLAWLLSLVTALWIRFWMNRSQSRLSADISDFVKGRLLEGAFKTPSEGIRRIGIGRFIGRMMDAQVLDSFLLLGAFSVASLFIELAGTFLLLLASAGGRVLGVCFLLCFAITLVLAIQFYRVRVRWSVGKEDSLGSRQGITHSLVEAMQGQKTRQAQQPEREFHLEEDFALSEYYENSIQMDRWSNHFLALVPRLWQIGGLLILMSVFANGQKSMGSVALALMGIFLAQGVLGSVGSFIVSLTDTSIAWKQVAPVFWAAEQTNSLGSLEMAAPFVTLGKPSPTIATSPDEDFALITARELSYTYSARSSPVLQHCNLTIRKGEKVLLQGPSGGGKSTLAALLAGLRKPDSGLLLLHGMDPQVWGEHQWRRRLVIAPQFHENHIFDASLAFNLLMGRRWPADAGDLQDAGRICELLGLKDLLDKMPLGLFQSLGETSWQLSHGEKSRIFLARALLQKAEVLILDESFGALDPETHQQAVRCTLEVAPTVLVIAHL